MLRWISIFGGLLIIMGQHSRSEALFYYFRLEDQVSENHLLRLIHQHISFEFVRERLRTSYSDTGRPSIDPELLLRILLIGYLYGISSERKLVEELRMHLATDEHSVPIPPGPVVAVSHRANAQSSLAGNRAGFAQQIWMRVGQWRQGD